jgi:flagellar biosynthesis chaperone FliJ
VPLKSLDNRIFIPAATLCRYLKYVEEKTRNINEARAIIWAATSKRQNRRRSSTPTEELKEEYEEEFREREKKAAEKAEDDDSSYKASSASEARGSGDNRL